MFLDILAWHHQSTVVTAGYGLMRTTLDGGEVGLEVAKLPYPLASLLVMRTVDFEVAYSLFKVHVPEVVEIGRVAVRAGEIGRDSPFDAALAEVLPTANYLPRITEHFRADLAKQFIRNLPDKVVGMSIYIHLVWSIVHCHNLQNKLKI